MALSTLAPLPAHAQPFDRNLVGYYPSWAVYDRNYHVPDIPAEKLNTIHYAFANIAGGEIALGDPYADIDRWYPGDSWDPDSLRGSFHQLQILKRAHPHLRTLISVGGWTWSTHFSDVALTEESRSLFARSCVEFVQRYGFDGVDVDWEYPVSGGHPGNTYRPEDRANYTLLLTELRRQLDAAGEFLLTIAGPASPFVIDNIELDVVHPLLDWINVMTYDFHGPWNGPYDPVTHFNAPLFAVPEDPVPEPARSEFNLAAAVEAYLARGVPAEKLHPGLAFYGRGYGTVVDQSDGLFVDYGGPAPFGTWEAGVFDFWELRAHYIDLGGYVSHRHEAARVPWLYNPATHVMISYDDAVSIADKGAYILAEDLGGAMLWELSADRDAELLTAIHDVLVGGTAGLPGDEWGSSDDPADRPFAGATVSVTPNPASERARIIWSAPSAGTVRVTIHDVHGRIIRAFPERLQAARTQSIAWDGRDGEGRPVPAGLYFVRVAGPDFAAGRPLLRLN